MGLEIGIVGLPNVGKSTLFNALTQAGAAVAGYPFTTIEPNVGIVPIADPRLARIADAVQPREILPTSVRFVDIAGLVRGAHRGEGLGNQFLGHIRGVDAIAMVVRCFEAANVPHVTEALDPLADVETVYTELVLADLASVERRLEKTRPTARAHPRELGQELEVLEALRQALNAGTHAGQFAAAAEAPSLIAEMGLLTAKPCMYVANIDEQVLPGGGELAARLEARAAAEGRPIVRVCARLEMELLELGEEDAAAYRAELGLATSSLDDLVAVGHELLGLITFFTCANQIVQAWTVRRGTLAPAAAGKIHSDMERGFIRAEVAHLPELLTAGSLARAREAGQVRLEGHDYVVQDGDVIHFRFAV